MATIIDKIEKFDEQKIHSVANELVTSQKSLSKSNDQKLLS